MHPDKNSAPGAEDAFKAVSKAFACLSDAQARKNYDVHGPDAPALNQMHHRRHPQSAYEYELSPEEIFEMMFGQGRQSGFRYTYRQGGGTGGGGRRQQQQQQGPQESDSTASLLIQFLPLLMIGFIIFFFSSGQEDPLFNLQRVNPYYVHRETANWGIPYYIKVETGDKINKKQINLESLERDVERLWKADTERKCQFEQQQKQKMERAAHYAYSDKEKEDLRSRIRDYEMVNCEALRKAMKTR